MEGPRSVRVEEFADLIRLVNLVFRGSEVPFASMEEEFPLLFNQDNLDHLYIIKDGQQIVAHVGAVLNKLIIYNAEITIASIGAVCTHPNHRGQGYASHLLRHCRAELREAGADLAFISGDQGLYKRAGCYPAGESYQFTIAKNDLGSRGASVEVQPAKRGDLGPIREVYEQESIRFWRTADDFRKLLSLGRNWLDGEREALVIRASGRFLAYLVLLCKARPNGLEGIVWEFSGSREAVIHLIPLLFTRYRLDKLTLYVNAYDHSLIRKLARKGLVTKGSLPGHTVGGLNFTRLVEKLRPYFAKTVGDKAARKIGAKESGGHFVLRAFGENHVIETGWSWLSPCSALPERELTKSMAFWPRLSLSRSFGLV